MPSEYLTINEAIAEDLIPKEYGYELSLLYKCSCGSHIVVNRALTEILCSNPNCRYKLAGRYMKSLSIFNLKGYGQVYYSDYIYTYGLTNIVDALQSALSAELFNEWRKVPHSADSIIKMMSLPDIDSAKSISIFKEYTDFDDFKNRVYRFGMYKFLVVNGIPYGDEFINKLEIVYNPKKRKLPFNQFVELCNNLNSTNKVVVDNYNQLDAFILDTGLYDTIYKSVGGSGKEARNITDVFYEYWDEILRMFDLCECRGRCNQSIKIVITGDIVAVSKKDGSSFNREEFVEFLNMRFNQYGIEIINGKARKSCMFVVADYPTSNASYIEGQALGKLISSLQLINFIINTIKKSGGEKVC